MPSNLTHLKSFLQDDSPGLYGTYGTPAAPVTGDTDWSGVAASLVSVDELNNATDGQIPIGKSGSTGLANPSTNPTLAANTGGSLAAGTYTVEYSYTNNFGETQATGSSNITFASGTTNKIDVSALTLPSGATQFKWYMSDAPTTGTVRYLTANSGSAFSITTLPSGSAALPPTGNTTASDNHTVKGTITGSTAVSVTNGPGSIALDLTNSGVTAGSYTSANITVDAKGRVTVAANGSGGGAIGSGTSFPGTPSDGDLYIRTDTTPKGLYRYNLGTTTWDLLGDGTGLSTSLANGKIYVGNGSGVATAQTPSGDLSMGNTGAFTLNNSGVTAGSYTSANITVDAKGRVTAAANGTGGGGSGLSSGTAFPGSPANGDLFFRTDLGKLYEYFTGFSGPSATWYPVLQAVKDDTTRTDSTTSLGAANSAQNWMPFIGTWGISSNKGYNVSNAFFDVAGIDTGSKNYVVQITMSGSINSPNYDLFGFLPRLLDKDNYIAVYPSDSTLNYQVRISNSFASGAPSSSSYSPTTNGTDYTFCCVVNGPQIDLYVNGVFQRSDSFKTWPSLVQSTYIGFYFQVSGSPTVHARFHDVIVRAI